VREEIENRVGLENQTGSSGETARRYRTASKKDKTGILDDFAANTACHRKYVSHILANRDKTRLVSLSGQVIQLKTGNPKKRKNRAGKTIYGPDVLRQPSGSFSGIPAGSSWRPF
jgi:hypothetical protein